MAFIPDFAAFCAALQTPRPYCLRVNTLRTRPDAVRELLMRQGYNVTASSIADELLLVHNLTHPGRLREALLGYYHPQALTSAMVSHIVAPQPDELVCDLCAAPGSKTSHMAQLMHNQGVIVANDPAPARLAMLEYNLKHLGISNVVTSRYSGQNFPLRCSSRGCWLTLRARERGIITGISKDACSMCVVPLARRPTCRVYKSSSYYGGLISWRQEGV